MTSRERVFRALNGEETDRPPIFVTLTPEAAQKLSKHIGVPYEEPFDSLLSTRMSHMNLLTKLGNDCVGIAATSPTNNPTRLIDEEKGVYENEWGMQFVSVGLYNEFYKYPLAHASSVEDIENYNWPDPYAEGRYDAAAELIAKYKGEYAIVADLETSFFETSWYLMGMEKLLMDMAMEEDHVFALFDKVMEINTKVGCKLIEMGADIIWAGDDFGTQRGMMISPDMWREVFKPRIKWMFEEFRKVNPDIKIAWHSCGSIIPIIEDFAEIGLDILNPIQPLAEGMEPNFLKENYGKQLAFFGGIDIQHLLPNGSKEDIQSEVKRRIEILGKGGGYIIAPAHNIQDDTPVENILAFYEAVFDYGKQEYPIPTK